MNTQQRKENLNKTRKGITMKGITYVQALEMAIKVCSVPANADDYSDVVKKLTVLKEKYSKPHSTSDEAKAKAKAKRANERAALMKQVVPILRDGLSNYPDVGQTAKELYEGNRDVLPADFTVNKVQYILLHEMADEVVKTEAKGRANIYKLAE